MKVSYISKFLFSLALVLAVGFIPTVAKGAVVDSASLDSRMSLFNSRYGSWLNQFTILNDENGAVNINWVANDQIDMNSLLYFSVAPERGGFLSGAREYQFNFQYGLRYPNSSNNVLSFDMSKAISVQCRGYNFSTGEYTYIGCSSGSFIENNTNYSSFSLVADLSQYSIIEFFIYFDIFSAFSTNSAKVNNPLHLEYFYRDVNYSYTSYTVNGYPSVDVPNSLPDLDEFIPSNGPFGNTLVLIVDNSLVVDRLLLVAICGVLAYVLFGKRS